jgi:hypothetical protein
VRGGSKRVGHRGVVRRSCAQLADSGATGSTLRVGGDAWRKDSTCAQRAAHGGGARACACGHEHAHPPTRWRWSVKRRPRGWSVTRARRRGARCARLCWRWRPQRWHPIIGRRWHIGAASQRCRHLWLRGRHLPALAGLPHWCAASTACQWGRLAEAEAGLVSEASGIPQIKKSCMSHWVAWGLKGRRAISSGKRDLVRVRRRLLLHDFAGVQTNTVPGGHPAEAHLAARRGSRATPNQRLHIRACALCVHRQLGLTQLGRDPAGLAELDDEGQACVRPRSRVVREGMLAHPYADTLVPSPSPLPLSSPSNA